MESSQKRINTLDLFSEKPPSLSAKFANLIFNNNPDSHLVEILVLIFEYLQLVSQAILLYPSLYQDSDTNSPFQRDIIYAAKLINPSYLLSFAGPKDSTAKAVISLVICWLISKYCIIVYIWSFVSKNKRPKSIPFHIFRWSLQLQSRVLYYFVTSFFFCSIIGNKENGFIFGVGKIGDFVVYGLFIFFEFYLAMSLNIQFHCILPTKSFLSSKDNTVEITNFLQKFIVQILQLFLSQTSIASQWILTLTNLVLALLRTFQYFATLPLYKVKSLFLEGVLIGVLTSLNIASLMSLIFSSSFSKGTNFMFIIWIILALLSIKLSLGLLKMIMFKVLTQNNLTSPDLLVHKIEIFKEFIKKQKLPSHICDHNNWFYLLIASIKENLNHGFCLSETKLDLSNKANTNNLFITHLENLLTKHPNSGLVKLYLASCYAKKVKSYARAIALINEVEQTSKFKLSVNASFLRSEIEKILRANYVGNISRINLYAYVQHQISLENLQKAIVKQIDRQSSVCEELLKNSPNLSKIFNSAQSGHKYRQEANKRIKALLVTIPEHCVRPLILFAYYGLIINQSPYDFQKLNEIYNLKNQKYQKYFQTERLCEENIYQDNCALFVVSGHKNDAGKVISCNTSVKRVCGGDPRWYIGSKIYHKICSPSLRPLSESFYRSFSNPETLALFINQTTRTYLYNKEGFLYECDFYVNLYPSISKGFFSAVLIRPALEKRDFILVRENGEIEGASQKVCKRLGIFLLDNSSKKIHISQISQELAQVSEAINTVSFVDQDKIKYDINITIKNQIKQSFSPTQKFQSIFVDEARRLYSLYTEKGNQIDLTPLDPEERSPRRNRNPCRKYTYLCKASNLVYDSIVLRLFSLEEIENDDESEIDDVLEEVIFFGDHSEVKLEILSNDDDDEFQNSKIDEEKGIGWTDLPRLESKQLIWSGLSKNKTSLATSGPLTTMKPRGQDLHRSVEKLVARRHQNPKKALPITTDRSKSDNEKLEDPNTQRNPLIPAKIAESVANSTSSKKSSTQSITRAIKLALEAKQYSKDFKRTISAFTILLIAILIIIILLFTNLNSTIENLRLKKNIMVSSQRRGYYIINIQTSTRSTFDLLTGVISPSDFGILAKPFAGFVAVVRAYAKFIYKANQDVLHWVNFLDNGSKTPFFEQSIQMVFQNNITQEMTSFQATDFIIQEIFDFLQVTSERKSVGTEALNLLTYNLVNDFLLKNRDIAVETLDSVQSQADTVLMLNNIYIIVICGCMLFLAGLLFVILWLQYVRKRNNLNHLTKISPFGIQTVLNNSIIFKETLLKDEDFRFQEFCYFGESKKTLKGGPKLSQNRASSANSHNSIQNEFLLFGVKATIIILLLTALLLIVVIFTPNSMKFLNQKIAQINYLGRLSNRVSRTTIATIELPIGNGTTIIEEMRSDVAIGVFLQELGNLRKELLTQFMDSDITNDYETSQIVFGNACNILGAPEALYCMILEVKTTNSSMTQLLASFETMITQRTEGYFNSDKSVQSLKQNRLQNYDLLLGSKRVLADSAIFLSDILDKKFEDKLEFLDSQRQNGLWISISGLFIMTLMMWALVLNPIKEVDNDFKKILQIFPAKLILSNFSLKLFLLENPSIDAHLIKNWG